MIQTEVKQLNQLIEEAIRLSKQRQTPQLLSITEIIDPIDPFLFYEQAKQHTGKRFFWSSSSDAFTLIGIGELSAFTGEHRNRFTAIEQQWQEIVTNTITYNPFHVPGTGPIAFGGFSFDPEKQQTALWRNFQHGQFRVPAYLLTVKDGTYYLPVNVMVREEDHPKQLQYDLEKERLGFLNMDHVDVPATPSIKTKDEIAPAEWKELVKAATRYIKDKNAGKIVLAREMRVTFTADAQVTPILKRLTDTQPNSFIFAYESGQDCFLGATPERLVSVHDRKLLSTCLAGTAPRGKTVHEDEQIGAELLSDQKNRAEHRFVVDMIRDAVQSCCVNVQVADEPVLYPLKNLQHLYTPVTATLNRDYSILDVVAKLHPTPALGGFPNEESLAFIRSKEQLDRGWYGSPVGWMDARQNGEFAVAIRSALVKGQHASLFAGCGVVRDSDPEAEYQETNIKFAPMLSVLGD